MKNGSVILLCCVLLSLILVDYAQMPEPPISQETCDALKSIAQGTQSSPVAQCTVQEEGCGSLNCVSTSAGSAELTLQPCDSPPSFFAEFFNLTDDLVAQQTLTSGTHNVDFGSTVTLIFTVSQIANGLSLQVDADLGLGQPISYIQNTSIPIDESLCMNSTISPSTTPGPSTTQSVPTPSESPTGSGCKQIGSLSLLIVMLAVILAS